MEKNWQQLVETAPTRSYQRKATHKSQLLARYVPKKAFDQGTPPTFLYTSGKPGRCNPAGVACIYLGEGSETAKAEFDSYWKKPLTELGYYARAQLRTILDLTLPDTCKHFGLSDTDFTRSFVTKSGNLIPLQAIGRAISKQSTISAIRFPSNAMLKREKTGFNLVIFQDIVMAPDFLEIMEDDRILERWPRT